MRTLAMAGSVLLAACSATEQESNSPGANDNTGPAATTSNLSGAIGGGTAPVTTPTTEGLTAQVSALTSEVSGLNTRITDLGLIIDLPSDALFEYDKADLTPASEAELRKAAELIRGSPPGPIRVIGHTDSHGNDGYNQTLSEARANAVADWFRQQVGVRQRLIAVSGKGETAPVAPNASPDGKDDPAGRAKNRRVEVIVPTSNQG